MASGLFFCLVSRLLHFAQFRQLNTLRVVVLCRPPLRKGGRPISRESQVDLDEPLGGYTSSSTTTRASRGSNSACQNPSGSSIMSFHRTGRHTALEGGYLGPKGFSPTGILDWRIYPIHWQCNLCGVKSLLRRPILLDNSVES